MFRTNNPALKPEVFAKPQTWDSFMNTPQAANIGAGTAVQTRPNVMTLQGTINASFILLSLTGAGAVLGYMLLANNRDLLWAVWLTCGIVPFLLGYMLIAWKPKLAPYLAPVFALMLGGFAAAASIFWTGYAQMNAKAGAMVGNTIVLQAGVLTFGVALSMLVAYTTRIIKPSQRLLGGIAAATGGVFFFMIAALVISFIYPSAVIGMWSSPIGLAIAGVIVVVAALNLIADFAIIESGVENRAPKYMEWFGAFGLVLTLVWLYVAMLRLVALLYSRD